MSTEAEPKIPSFDLRGPLPTGVTVLEASAGTGKTYTIAALAARYVAEGTPLERLLLVTFTRMATGELRARVRERLVSVEKGLRRALAGVAQDAFDEVVALLAEAPELDLRMRCDRLSRALANFDAATIATTHGFCQEMLAGLGVAGDLERDTAFVEDTSDLVGEVVDDLYVRRFHRADLPPFDRSEAGAIARVAVQNPAAPIVPTVGVVPDMRRRLALAVRDELERRKRRMAIMTYDDLLTRLDDILAGDGGGAAVARLRARYDVVLVDEFQDTDPIQWDIMRRAFGETGATLVLVGDPKQAIYAFRGGDVYAYLDAARSAQAHATLDVNWRSDQRLIDAYDAIFAGTKLGHEGIVYRRVRAAAASRASGLRHAPHQAPLRIRVVHRDGPWVTLTRTRCVSNASAREHIATDLAADLVALLSSGAEIESRSGHGEAVDRERIRPGHIAVLVRTNRNAAQVREALEEVGIPAVISGAGSVFGTSPAVEWLRLLEAIERPTSQPRAHAAVLTCFFGWPAEQVAAADEEAWEVVHRRLYDWARVLRVKGVASLFETITMLERLAERVLATAGGERQLTDLRHVGQLLHEASTSEHLGTTSLVAWLRRRIDEAQHDTTDEDRSRRLETDAEAIQVLTIHRSKGLEFPIVYAPFLWEPGYIPSDPEPVVFHDPEADERRTVDVSLDGADFSRHRDQNLVEERGEDLRLAYVALTRARHQAVVWWAGSWDSRNSPLGRLIFARDAEGNVAARGTSTPDDADAVARFEALAAEAPGCIAVERSTLTLPVTWTGPSSEPVELTAAVFDRTLDWRWRRTSYSDITAGTHEDLVGSEPEDALTADEPELTNLVITPAHSSGERSAAAPSLLGEMPAGLRIGTLVHRVLQETDFAAADLDAELATNVAAARAWRPLEIGDPHLVLAGLRAAIETPLGPLLGGLSLRDVGRADRLDELEFELPLAGGDEPTGRLALSAIRTVLRDRLTPGDPLAEYAERLEDPSLRQTVGGYLVGSIDLVVRTWDADGVARFAVVDYKTNWLGVEGETLSAWHYRPSAVGAEMQRAHYGLQALLYLAALHRYLRWRLPDYDAARNLAGVLYLFLRGMTGPDAPTVGGVSSGVFSWRPPPGLVEALSDVLDDAGPA